MRKTIFLALVSIVFLIAGCGGGSSGSTPTTGSLKVTNSSAKYVYYLYLSPASASSWGVDQLGASHVIAPGGSYTITSVPPGTYDSKVTLNSGNSYYAYGFSITAGSTYTLNVPSSAVKAIPGAEETAKPATPVDGGAKEPASPDQETM